MRGETMKDERKRELLELFRQTSYMPYHEVWSLLLAYLPERSTLIKRMLVDDIRQFKLKVYFWTTYSYGDEIPLLDPVHVTPDTLGYHVPPPSENYASFWLFGELSTAELKNWLQDRGVASSFLEPTELDATINEALPHQRKSQREEVTQEEAAMRVGVTTRTIRNWDKGKQTPQGYPGRQSRTHFMVFAEGFKIDKSLKKKAREAQRAQPGGDMSEFSEKMEW